MAASRGNLANREGLQNRIFAGKLDQIERQYTNFWNVPCAAADIEAYEKRITGHQYGGLDKWIKATTPFTDWQLNPVNEGKALAYNRHCLLIGNHSSFDVVQYPENPAQAGMSMIHILGIPRENLFNGVSLGFDNVCIIWRLICLFKVEWRRPQFRQAVLEHQRRAIESRNNAAPDDARLEVAASHWRELQSMINLITEDDFAFGLHLWPDNSIGHLHLHIIATPEIFRRYSTLAHDEKTKDALEVVGHVLSR
ncbi:uncharacterized protein F4822DRAFT_444472 [Hypoxylon trugodes]|uniref:uncharacterized protein n=1 Tax=Hypoxylon trugodes TaxID=326681 RepID=UPI0021969566|nr:uncharacterized protein F4822DRAFT_444472 [Hypoxylon trugodes]KAI1387999.1 hypothetical protein F4822DRAFT_444472 [Hypoxylon trugodes]